jgi:uracil-DNA glycosylase
MEVRIEPSWKQALAQEFEKSYFQDLAAFVRQEYASQTIYPAAKDVFAAFEHTPFDKVRVVIVGQDPYHGKGQAHGLSFSVNQGVAIPPSLRNIFKEIHADLGTAIPTHGNLEHWAKQGVLLLNAVLTVRAGKAASHQKKGWEIFTDAVLEAISQEREQVVFLLWGRYAQEKGRLIDRSKHLVLEAPHPSPMAQGFLGCRHFSQTNQYLIQQGLEPIAW